MPERNPLQAAGDTLTVQCPRDRNSKTRVGVQGIGGAVGLVGIIEQSMDDGVTYEAAAMAQPAAGGAATSALSAVGSSLLDSSGCTHVRYRITGLTSGGPVQARINSRAGL